MAFSFFKSPSNSKSAKQRQEERKRLSHRKAFFESLEDRNLMAVLTWQGDIDANWSSGTIGVDTNWDTNNIPQDGDTLVFAGAAPGALNNDTAALNSYALQFTAGGYTINGNSITLDNPVSIDNPSGDDITDNSGNTINTDLVLDNAAPVTTANITAGTTTLGGVVSGATGSLTKIGAGTLSLTNNNTFAGTTTVTAGVLHGVIGGTVAAPTTPFGTSSLNIDGGNVTFDRTAGLDAGITRKTVNPGNNSTTAINYDLAGTTAVDTQINRTPPSGEGSRWTGLIQIATPGNYQFLTRSDDGSRLYIDGVLVVTNDGSHGAQNRTSTAINLTAGFHSVLYYYGEGTAGGGGTAQLQYSGPDQPAMGLVPGARFFQSTPISLANNVTVTNNGGGINVVGNVPGLTLGTLNIGAAGVTNFAVNAVTGRRVNFGTTNLVASAATVNFSTDRFVGLGRVVDAANTNIILNNAGTGQLILDNTAAAPNGNDVNGTTLRASAGRLVVVGSNVAGATVPVAGAQIDIAGGTVTLDSKIGNYIVPTTTGVTVSTSGVLEVVPGNSTLEIDGTVTIPAAQTLTVTSYGGNSQQRGGLVRIDGQVTGAGNLTKNNIQTNVEDGNLTNTGFLQLNNNTNNYQGTTTVNGGTLTVSVSNGLGDASGNTIVATGAQLRLQNTITIPAGETISISGTGPGNGGALRNENQNNVVTDQVILNANATIVSATAATSLNLSGGIEVTNGAVTFDGNGNTNVSGAITRTANANGVTKNNATGILQFSGAAANTYTGNTIINDGVLELNKTAGVNAIAAGTIQVGNGGANDSDILRLLASDQIAGAVALDIRDSGLFNLNGFSDAIGSLTLRSGNNIGSTVTTGAATLTLGGNVTLNTTAGGDNTGANITGNLDLGGVTRTFTINDPTGTTTDLNVAAVISNGGVTKAGAGQLEYTGAAANTYAGNTVINAGQLRLNKTAGVDAIAGGIIQVGDSAAGNDSDLLQLIASNQINNAVGVDIRSSGRFNLNNNSESIVGLALEMGTGQGATVNTGTGTLTLLGNVNVTGAGGNTTADITGGGTIDFGGATRVITVVDAPAITTGNDLTFNGVNLSNGAIDKQGAGTLQFTGAATFSATLTTVNVGAGTFQHSGGGATFNVGAGIGAIDVQSGATFLSNTGILINGALNILLGGTARFTAGSTPSTASISGAGNLILGNPAAANAVPFTTGSNNLSTVFSGVISNDSGDIGSLTKVGTGMLTLSNINTYQGTTTVNDGTLRVNGAINSTAAVTMNNAAILDGTGTIAGSVTLNNTSRLSPGNSVESLATGTVVFTSGSFFDVELDGTAGFGVAGGHDILLVTGGVTLGNATLNFSGTLVANPNVLQTFTIIDNNGSADAVTGTFAGLPEGGNIELNGVKLYISYVGGDGNDVVLSSQLMGSGIGDTLVVTPLSATSISYQLNGGAVQTATNINKFTFQGQGDDDRMIVQLNGSVLPSAGLFFHGNGHNNPIGANPNHGDVLTVIDPSNTLTANYNPDGVAGPLDNDGTVTIPTIGTINFVELEPVDIVGFLNVNLAFVNADENITLTNGTDAASSTNDALVVSGNSGGVAFEAAHLIGNTNVVIDTTTSDGNDTVTIASGNNGHANVNLTINTGLGTDTITVNGNLLLFNDTTFDTQNIIFNGGTVTSGNLVTLDAGTGAITSTNAATDVAATSLRAFATTGIGSSVNVITTIISNLEAQTSTGGIFFSNTGDLQIGGVDATLTGVNNVGATGEVSIVNTGDILVTLTDEIVTAPQNVTLNAIGLTSDIRTAGNSASAQIESTTGHVFLTAGQDILIGDAGLNQIGDVLGGGEVNANAGRDIIVTADSVVVAQIGFDLTFIAGNDVSLSPPGGAFGPALLTEGGDVIITAGGNFTSNGGVTPSIDTTDITDGNISITAANILLGDGILAGTGDITLNATVGFIQDTSIGTNQAIGNDLIADAVTGIAIETNVDTINASVSAAGFISIGEVDTVNLLDLDTFNGFITVVAGNAITATDVQSLTDNDANDITITANTGNIDVVTVNAGTTAGDVTLTSTLGSINDDSNDATLITGDVVSLSAALLIGNVGAAPDIDTTANNINFSAGTGTWITETNAVTFDTVATSAAGPVILQAGGDLTLNVATLATTGNVRITTTGTGDIIFGTLGSISANGGTGDVRLNSADDIADNHVGVDIFATNLNISAGDDVATSGNPLETTVANFAASTGGDLFIAESNTLDITSVTAFGVTLNGIIAGGNMRVSTVGLMNVLQNVSAGGNGTLAASETGATNDTVALANGISITAGTALTLNFADDETLNATHILDAGTVINLASIDTDLGSNITMQGSILAPVVNAVGAANNDNFLLMADTLFEAGTLNPPGIAGGTPGTLLNMIGNAGNDNFGNATNRINPNVNAQIDIDGDNGGPNAPFDQLWLDASVLFDPVIFFAGNPAGTLLGNAAQRLDYDNIDNLTFYDNDPAHQPNAGVLTNVNLGALFVRTGDLKDGIQFTRSGVTTDNVVVTLTTQAGVITKYGPFPMGPITPAGRIVVYANEGNDTITASSLIGNRDVEFHGEEGNDYLAGSGGNDLLIGGIGTDTIIGNAGNNVIWGDDENVTELGTNPNGPDGNDIITSGAGNDIIYGAGGNDSITAGAGNDVLYGGANNDTINAGAGNDLVRGSTGNDTISGDDGHDILLGGTGNDKVYGRAGNDIVLGGFGNDTVTGETGNDIVSGGDSASVEALTDAALLALVTAWNASTPAGFTGLNGLIVDDLLADTINGGTGADLFFVHNTPLTPATHDSYLPVEAGIDDVRFI